MQAKVLTMDEARQIAVKRCKMAGDLLGKRATAMTAAQNRASACLATSRPKAALDMS